MSAPSLSRHTVDGVGRVYFDPEDNYYLSVTTILDEMPKSEGLLRWKERNDGEGDTPHWREIRDYKRDRGTLIHYHCLNQYVEGDMWSPDEGSSEANLKDMADPWEERLPAWTRYEKDLHWAKHHAWEMITRVCGIDEESVMDVEFFVANDQVGYAGQFDLLYSDPETGETVLADIKTSKYVYEKHKLQLTAYAQAVDVQVDRVEVLRMNPDFKEWEVSRSDEWESTRIERWDRFLELVEQADDERIAEIRDEASGAAEQQHTDS